MPREPALLSQPEPDTVSVQEEPEPFPISIPTTPPTSRQPTQQQQQASQPSSLQASQPQQPALATAMREPDRLDGLRHDRGGYGPRARGPLVYDGPYVADVNQENDWPTGCDDLNKVIIARKLQELSIELGETIPDFKEASEDESSSESNEEQSMRRTPCSKPF